MTTIQEHFGLRDVAKNMIADRNYGKTLVDIPVVSPDLIIGLELEIEKWQGTNAFTGFSFTEDNSLRGEAIEAITLPTKLKFVPSLLTNFYKAKEITQDNYSERCSTHVHVNCQDMTPEQVQTVCVIYQAVERLLFTFVGNNRDSNIFCVPWYQCTMSHRFVSRFLHNTGDVTRRWQKYTALNLLPLQDKGTVEFRHLHGTCDVQLIIMWLNFLACIFKYAKEGSFAELREDIMLLNSNSAYERFLEKIFQEYAIHLQMLPDSRELLSMGIVDCKLLFANDKAEKKTQTTLEELRAMIRDMPPMPAVPRDLPRARVNNEFITAGEAQQWIPLTDVQADQQLAQQAAEFRNYNLEN